MKIVLQWDGGPRAAERRERDRIAALDRLLQWDGAPGTTERVYTEHRDTWDAKLQWDGGLGAAERGPVSPRHHVRLVYPA